MKEVVGMKKKKAFLFPYTINNCEIVKHKKLLTCYDIVGVDTLTLELRGKDISYLYNGKIQGMKIGEKKSDYEVLLLGDGGRIDEDFDRIFDYAKFAVQNGKDISILYCLTESQRKKFKALCSENNVRCHMFSGLHIPDKLFDNEYEMLSDISVPIVLVTSVAENTGKFEIQLGLHDYFTRAGYKVSQIGTKNFCELFGFYSFPQFMFEEISEVKKIVGFNALCRGLEYQEKPDLFIIGVPGSLLSYNSYFTSKFGIIPFEIGRAIKADSVIMALDNAPYERVGLENINNICNVYYGNEVTAFSISNFRIDVEKSIFERSIGYVVADKENVQKNINNIMKYTKKDIYNLLEYEQLLKLANYVENDLSDMDIKLL